jgi:hypothetical protein
MLASYSWQGEVDSMVIPVMKAAWARDPIGGRDSTRSRARGNQVRRQGRGIMHLQVGARKVVRYTNG